MADLDDIDPADIPDVAPDDLDNTLAQEPAEPQHDEPTTPKPRVSILTIVLLVFNLLGAAAFLYLVFMDYQVRHTWSKGYLRNQLGLWGLPLLSEEKTPFARESRPRLRLDADQLKRAFMSAGRGGKGGGSFGAIDEYQNFLIRPEMMTDEVKKDLFKGLNEPVGTLDEELTRVKRSVPSEIAKVAAEAAAPLDTDSKKAKVIRAVLLPLAWSPYQVDLLEKQIVESKGEALSQMLQEALQRRMYADVLAPANLFRSGNVEKMTVEKIADLKNTSLDQIKEMLEKRLDQALLAKYDPESNLGTQWTIRDLDSLERRQQAAFMLFAISQVRVPLKNDKLFPKAFERTQAVVGLNDFTIAMARYASTLPTLRERVMENIRYDRTNFIHQYRQEIEQLRELVKFIDESESRLADLQEQRTRYQKVLEAREKQKEDATAKLVNARTETAKVIQQLREFQDQLYRAELELSDAAETNLNLEAQIQKTERSLRGGKR